MNFLQILKQKLAAFFGNVSVDSTPQSRGDELGDILDEFVDDKVSSVTAGLSTLGGLTDTDIQSPSDGQFLKYNSSNQRWQNGTVPTATYSTEGIAAFDAGSFTITGGVVDIKTGGISSTDIANDSINETQLSNTLDLSSTSVTLANGEISNSELANSSITLGSDTVNLGDTVSDINGLTSLDAGNLTLSTNVISNPTNNSDINITTLGAGATNINTLRVNNAYTFPTADGTSGYVLQTDGSGNITFQPVTITQIDIVNDTTPQLGGSLDVNGNSIVSVSNGDITVAPDGTGKVVLDGLNYPDTDGATGQVISTDGAGTLSFTDVTDTRLTDIFDDTKEPTGFTNRVDSTLSFNQGTETFTIAPVATDYEIYIKGNKITISNSQSIQLTSGSGNYYLYLDANGTLNYMTSFNVSLFQEYAYCSFIYWNDTQSELVVFGDERHGITMDAATHGYLHLTRGTQLVSGAAITYTLGDGSLDTHAQVGIGNMQIRDEDIIVDIVHAATPSNPFEQVLSSPAEIPIWYREGASEWRKTTANTFPLITGTARAKFNEFTGGSWQLTEAPSNNKLLVTYIFGTTNINEPVVGILGQNQYQNVDDARENGSWEQIDFGELPAPEMKLLYTLYYETSSNYTNNAQSKIVFVGDFRFSADRETPAAAFSNIHANLVGLSADDHPQYFNQARGDARYYTQTLLDGGQLDSRYYTETEVNTLLANQTFALSDITQSGANTGEVPQWNGANWVPAVVSGGGGGGATEGFAIAMAVALG